MDVEIVRVRAIVRNRQAAVLASVTVCRRIASSSTPV